MKQIYFNGSLFYAINMLEVANREDSWTLLRHLATQTSFPWVCLGDFNEITHLEEKFGGGI